MVKKGPISKLQLPLAPARKKGSARAEEGEQGGEEGAQEADASRVR